MRIGFFFGMAKDGIRKNKQLYLPYILTCIGMVMMYYIIEFLQKNETIGQVKGGSNAQYCLMFGGWVIAFFACIFLFYTNSFLIRRRKKEFGLYNMLGMGRKHIGIILLWESILVAAISLTVGLVFGILLSKIAELGMLCMLKMEVSYKFLISGKAVSQTILVFFVIFALLYINSLLQIRFTNTLALLGSEKVGEKPPKANWIIGISGFVVLGVAYYMAVTIENPLAAITIFFLAVLMVIAATYLILISGSVVLCRLLQKNKKFYYKKANFISVSSMVYRMKRNGAGLASICILSTMVLIMISSTSCLYFGSEDALNTQYPREIGMNFYGENSAFLADENVEKLKNIAQDICKKQNVTIQNEYFFRAISFAGVLEKNQIEWDVDKYGTSEISELKDIKMVYILPISDLLLYTGEKYDVSEDEIYLYASKNYKYDTLKIEGANEYKVKGILKENPLNKMSTDDIVESIYIFVHDTDSCLGNLATLKDYRDNEILNYGMNYNFDTGLSKEEQIAFTSFFKEEFDSYDFTFERGYTEGREANREDFFATFGGLFYLGIVLSIVFIFAAALIIYYKQVSEGYEDQARFEIMQKVGMTKKEIRRSIDAQILMVFFLPLLLAGLHVCFAFPMIKELLYLFSMFNVKLFIATSLVSFLVFCLIYVLVYRATSNAYFSIVSSKVS